MMAVPSKVLLVSLLLLVVTLSGCMEDQTKNRAPIADAGSDMTSRPYQEVGKSISFSGKGTTDPDGDQLEYSWDFDADDGSDEDQDRTGRTATWTYDAPGTYTVTLLVSDGYEFDKDSLKVKVVDPPGELKADLQTDDETRQVLGEDETATIDLDGSDSTNTEGGKDNIIKYEWDLSYNASSGFETDEDTGQDDSLRHDFESGLYLVRLRVTNASDYTDESDTLYLFFNYNQSEADSIGSGSQYYKLPVNTLEARWIRVRLQYDDGGLGLNNDDLDLYLYDAQDNEVASNTTHDTDHRYQINEILLEASNATQAQEFDDEDELGDWKVEVRHERSWGDDPQYKLFMDVVYYED